jgi:hypothetical protein
VINLFQLLHVKALISINQLVESEPQSFSQSFASSSAVKPNGQIISSSIYTDSKGNRVVNGAGLKIPQLFNDLLPPLLPGEIKKPFVLPFQPIQPLVPVIPAIRPSAVPVTTRPTVKTTTRPSAAPVTTRSTVKTTIRSSVTPITTRATTRAAATFNRITSAVKPAKYAADLNSEIEGKYVPDTSGVYVHDPAAGAYVHDKNVGAYMADDRGKYRSQ